MGARRTVLKFVAGCVVCLGARVSAWAGPPDPLGEHVRATIDAVVIELQETGDFEAAQTAIAAQFDRVIAYAELDDKDLFRDAAYALRLVRQLREVDEPRRMELLAYLREHPRLAGTLAFLIRAEHEKPAEIYDLLDRLRRARGDKLPRYAALTAAICVVHERPFKRRINENTARSTDPLHVFDFYVAHDKRLNFSARKMPEELLIYVVDTTATPQEMEWALRRYAGDQVVGERFFDIEYDTRHFRTGAPKKVNLAGWNLPNILTYGGVCADQAYFAMTVGKSIGVPTAYAVGRSSEMGHAWVGFLQARGKQAWWNFDVGRYEAYQGVRGNVLDAQIRKRIPDSYVSLLAELGKFKRSDRWASSAYTDAAMRVLQVVQDNEDAVAAPGRPPGEGPESVRPADLETALMLIEQGLRTCPAQTRGWTVIRELAADDRLTLPQIKRWAEVLHRLCGRRYPDFYLSVLGPMIASIDDVEDQNALWNKAFALFSNRHDLAASVRMSQARMWKGATEPDKAGMCYEDVIFRYANAGRFVLKALEEAEKILRWTARGDRVLVLYDRAFNSIAKPSDKAGPFYRYSNYYLVGLRYADHLEQAGRGREASSIRSTVRGVVGH